MATCAIHHRVFLSEVGCPLCVSTPELTGSTAFAAENHALKARLAELESKLGAHQTAVEQARRDLRQALDIMESGRDDSEAFRVVRLRIYEAGKQLASVE